MYNDLQYIIKKEKKVLESLEYVCIIVLIVEERTENKVKKISKEK
jgi:hypothetical protein